MEFSAVYKGITISFLSAVLSIAAFVPQQALAQKQPNTAQRPWMNKALSPDQRADLVIHQMTLDEKIQMVHGTGWGVLKPGSYVAPGSNLGAGYTEGVERLGIPGINMADSAVGIRMAALQSRYATLLPSTLGAASSWDPKAAFLYGSVIGREAWAQGFNMSIGGGLDITREPRNGRNFEYAGEDPVLAGIMTGELELGVKSEHVMSDIKHYALNDQETGRNVVNVLLDKRSMRESDLLAFEIAITLAKPSAVMCSYNLVNGDHACENDYLLNEVLKKDFDFKGFVVSDWGGTHSTVKAALNGLDQDEPGDDNYFSEPLKKAVEDGQVPKARLDDMVHRILRSMFDAGVIDHPPVRTVVDPFRGRDDAQHIAEESIVLLKNADNVLPLKPSASIAIIGSHADVGVLSGGGSAQVDAPGGNAIDPKPGSSPWGQAIYFPSSPLRYIREKSPQSNVQYIDGKDNAAAAKLAKDSSLAIVFVTQPMREGQDAPTLSLPDNQDALVEAVAAANPNTIVVLETGGPVTMPWAEHVKGIVEMWYPGIGGAQALSNILFGDVNPSGKLPVTFAKNDDQLPHPTVPGLNPHAKATGDDQHHEVGPFDLKYTEGAKVGYKWFEATDKQPLFPFGFGLSYTTYAYSGLTVDDATHTARFTVKNTGSRDGTEIAELYVALPSAADEHFKRLAGWERVKLAPGESKEVSITLKPLYLSIFDPAKNAWQLLPGDYKVMVGGSSSDTPLDATLHVQK
jgi:beta-glucosidase